MTTDTGSLTVTLHADDALPVGDMLLTVVAIRGQQVTLRITAPRDVKIGRIQRRPRPQEVAHD